MLRASRWGNALQTLVQLKKQHNVTGKTIQNLTFPKQKEGLRTLLYTFFFVCSHHV